MLSLPTQVTGLLSGGLNVLFLFNRCQQIEALDFGHCIHLLHPTVFLSIRDKAPKLVSLSFENSEVVSDDIVQVSALNIYLCP